MHIVDSAVKYIRSKVGEMSNLTAIILGNGFEDFLNEVVDKVEIPFSALPAMKFYGKDKNNRFIFGKINDKDVLVVVGRLHYNLGYDISDIANLVFILKELGCVRLVLTASLGSINPKVKVGDIVTATDHINMTGRNPLYKCDYSKYGHAFVDMQSPYDEVGINNLIITAKHEMNIKIKRGVVMEFAGPSSETTSEALMARELGADFIGFNICNEVISCKYCDLPVTLFALITNYGASLTASHIKHDDIVYNRTLASGYYTDLLKRFILNF